MEITTMTDKLSLMTPESVSTVLQVPPSRLARWRSKGVGPDYVKIEGRVLYSMDAVVDFINRSTVRHRQELEVDETAAVD
jgi:hypothetical protein